MNHQHNQHFANTSASNFYTKLSCLLCLLVVFALTGCDVSKRDIKQDRPDAVVIERLPPEISISAPTLIYSGDVASLTATVVDPDGVPSKLSWVQTSGTPVELSSTRAESISFTAPMVLNSSESLTFELTATPIDQEGFTTTESVSIDLYPFPLTVTAEDKRVTAGDSVILFGASNVGENHPQSIQWEQISGTSVALSEANTYTPSFTAPEVLSPDTLVFNLTVSTEGIERSTQATVSVAPSPDALELLNSFAQLGNATPVLTEKTFSATPGSVVRLVSVTPLPAGTSIQWDQVSGAPVVINGANSDSASFTMPFGQSSPLVFQLSATEASGITKVVNQKVFSGPISNTPNTITALAGSPVSVHATTTSPDTASKNWVQISGPAVTLTGNQTSTVTFTAPQKVSTDNHTITLEHTVTPSTGAPIVTMHKVNLAPKEVIVQREINAFTGSTVTLHADTTGSESFEWSQLSGPSVSLTDITSQTTQFTAPDSTSGGQTITVQNVATTGGTPLLLNKTVYTVHLVSPPPPLTLSVTTGAPQLAEGSLGVLHSSAAGGTPPYSYAWTQESGPAVSLDLSNVEAPTFIAPVVSASTPLEFSLTITDADGVSQTAPASFNVEPSLIALNLSPSPDVLSGARAFLHASASSTNGAVALTWTQVSGPSVTLDTSIEYSPVFTAPTVISSTLLEFEVTATDASGAQTDSVFVRVTPNAPMTIPPLEITPTPQLSLNEGKRASLNVSVAGGDGNYTYSWLAKTPGLSIVDATIPTPEIIAPLVSADETASLVVTVTDTSGNSVSAPVSILVRNVPLLVDAGSDIKINDDVETSLHARVTQKTSAPYSYNWTQVSGGSVAQITGDNTANPVIGLPADISETYEFELEVTDANGETATDSILVTATFDLGADAGVDQTVTEATTVSLHGTDVGGLGATSVSWAQLEGQTVSLLNATTLNPSFTAPITQTNSPEKLVFEITATDAQGRIAKDTVVVDVEPRLPAVSVAGADRFPELSASTLLASVSGGTPPYTYSWTQSGDFSAVITSADNEQNISFTTPTFNAQTDKAIFQVEVTDARGHTAVGTHGFLLYATPSAPDLTLVESIAGTMVSGSSAPATVEVTAGTSPYSFDWSDDSTGTFAPDNTVQNPGYTAPVVAADKTVNVRVNVSDSVNASDTAVQPVLVTAVPLEVKINSNTTVVRGQQVQLNADISGGIQPYLIKAWRDNTTKSDIGTGQSIALDTSDLEAGDYTISFITRSSPPALSLTTRQFILSVKNPPRTLTVPGAASLKAGDSFTGTVSVSPTFAGEAFTFDVTPAGSGPAISLSSISGISSNLSADSLAAGVNETYTVTATQGSEILTASFTLKTPAAAPAQAPLKGVATCVPPLCGVGIPGTETIVNCPTDKPYALNTVERTGDGFINVTKSCGSTNDCQAKWWRETSDVVLCTEAIGTSDYFEQSFTFPFSCSYCCVTDGCNVPTVPARNTLFKGTAD
ncbi:hypothetical protein ACFO4O_05425 [Glaciecola siphonariae]|uniref:Ig-like domain-containing protein n=1 Tax=Glaciecola siphonariae TaxID=521012 RepID=A0ABV9LVF5_9ALTE